MFENVIGLRGSGKTSYAAKYARKMIKKGYKVFCNFPLQGCYIYDYSDVGYYDISNCAFIFDEAGIDCSNRDFAKKSTAMSRETRRWWKLTRHYKVEHILVLSQALDYDITLRRLADRTTIITKGLLPHFSRRYFLQQYWDVDEQGQPIIKFKIPLLFIPFFRKPYYKYFDSYEAPELPHKDFEYIPLK